MFFTSCSSENKNSEMVELTVDFSFKKENICKDYSPEIRITGIPKKTEILRIQFDDLYAGAHHGGWSTISNDGTGIVPPGNLKNFRGPCDTNKYKFTVKAIDKENMVIGIGKKSKICDICK
jgi:phosphatidylethanolamine-binding protein (PEBP) family uncharacterized protein